MVIPNLKNSGHSSFFSKLENESVCQFIKFSGDKHCYESISRDSVQAEPSIVKHIVD